MVRNFPAVLAFTLEREGGYVWNKKDPGGATNLGITIGTLSKWLNRPASVDEVKSLTKDVSTQIYKAWYWNTVCGDALSGGVDLMVFDMGVNSGAHEAAVELQNVLSVEPDGHIGKITLSALESRSAASVVEALAIAQKARYESLANFQTFGDGWLRRLVLRHEAAKALL